MSWHIVFAFRCVTEEVRLAAGESLEELFQVVGGGWVRVLLNEQASRGVLQEKVT
jgi:hypothetical protein